MFIQSRVVYIVKNFAGQPSRIIEDLIKNKIFNYFFDDLSVTSNRNFLKFISSLPKNTVFCIDVSYNPTSREMSNKTNIAIPFISSHINFPVKLGEIVWFYRYSMPDDKRFSVETYEIDGYYLGRVHSLLNTEDSAYCFHDRETTIFSHDKVSPSDTASLKSKKGILAALEHNEEFIPETIDLIEKPSIDIVTDISKNILNNDYYHEELLSYKLKPINTTATKSEDVVLKGSHNTVLELGSCSFEERISESGGKIKIIAGNNEKLRNKSFEGNVLLSSRSIDNTVSNKFIDTKVFKNGIESTIDNSIFYETIKTTNQFVNPDVISQEILQGITNNVENNISNNSSTFIVSQYGFDNKIISQQINYSIPFIYDEVSENISNGIRTYMPENEQISLISKEINSSIVGLSDDITFKIHDDSSGSISFISSSQDLDYQNYIMLKEDNIHLNSNKIVIGDINRSKDQASGYNASLFLGYGDDMQSLVRGEQLNDFLREIIDIQKTSISIIKDLFINSRETDEFIKETLEKIRIALNSTSVGLSSIGANAALDLEIPKVIESINKIDVEKYSESIVNFKAKKEEDLFERLTSISDNLELVLSKFVKSS